MTDNVKGNNNIEDGDVVKKILGELFQEEALPLKKNEDEDMVALVIDILQGNKSNLEKLRGQKEVIKRQILDLCYFSSSELLNEDGVDVDSKRFNKIVDFLKNDKNIDLHIKHFLNIFSIIDKHDKKYNKEYRSIWKRTNNPVIESAYAAVSLAILEMLRVSIKNKNVILDDVKKGLLACLDWFLDFDKKNEESDYTGQNRKIMISFVIFRTLEIVSVHEPYYSNMFESVKDMVCDLLEEMKNVISDYGKTKFCEVKYDGFYNYKNGFSFFLSHREEIYSQLSNLFHDSYAQIKIRLMALFCYFISERESFTIRRNCLYSFWNNEEKDKEGLYDRNKESELIGILENLSKTSVNLVGLAKAPDDISIKTGNNNSRANILNIRLKIADMLKKRKKMFKAKVLKNEDKYVPDELKKALEAIEEGYYCLGEGYTAIGSDFSADYLTLYSFLVGCGYLIPDDESLLVGFFGDPYEENEKTFNIKYDLKNEKDVFSDDLALYPWDDFKFLKLQDGYCYVLVLPGFHVNEKFKGKIELLGDFIDKGDESLKCMMLLDYLTQREKTSLGDKYCEEKKVLHLHIGNHDVGITGSSFGYTRGLYNTSKFIMTMIKHMIEEGRMTHSCIRKIGESENYVSFSCAPLCKKHIFKIVNIISKFYELLYELGEDGNENGNENENVLLYEPESSNESGNASEAKSGVYTRPESLINYNYIHNNNRGRYAKIIDEDKGGNWKKLKDKFVELKETTFYKSLFDRLEKSMLEKKEVLDGFFETASKTAGKTAGLDKNLYAGNDKAYMWFCLGLIVKENLAEGYEKLKNEFGFKDEDYFTLRRFIVEAIPLHFYGGCLNIERIAEWRGESKKLNEDDVFFAKDAFIKNLGTFFEDSFGTGGYLFGPVSKEKMPSFWPIIETYVPKPNEMFDIVSYIGRKDSCTYRAISVKDATCLNIFDVEKLCGFYLESIICVDSSRCYKFDENYKKYYKEKKSRDLRKCLSDYLLLIRTPDGKHMLEGFSLNHFKNFSEDSVTDKDCFIVKLEDKGYCPINKSGTKVEKKYGSVKSRLKAFYNIELNKKSPKNQIGTGSEKSEDTIQ